MRTFFNAAVQLLFAGALFAGAACAPETATSDGVAAPVGVVNLYTARHYDSDLDVYAAFTRETGIRVNIIEAGGDALIERLVQEAEHSPADIFMTADAGILWRAQSRGLLQPIQDPAIIARAPGNFVGPDNLWIGLTKRARVIIYNKDHGRPPNLERYEGLASPQFRGRICMRSSSNIYNQSLLASMIAREGESSAGEWVRGVVANFARRPQGNDTTQIEAVAAGQCGLSLVNSYYIARYLSTDDPQKRAIGEKIGVIFPNQDTTGAHVNISGAGVAAHAPHRENAEKLIAYLLSDAAQQAFALGNNEYPVVPGVAVTGPVAALGAFREDGLDVARLGEHQREAVLTYEAGGWR